MTREQTIRLNHAIVEIQRKGDELEANGWSQEKVEAWVDTLLFEVEAVIFEGKRRLLAEARLGSLGSIRALR